MKKYEVYKKNRRMSPYSSYYLVDELMQIYGFYNFIIILIIFQEIYIILTTHKSVSRPDYQDSATTAPAIHSLYEYQATGNYTYCQSDAT